VVLQPQLSNLLNIIQSSNNPVQLNIGSPASQSCINFLTVQFVFNRD